MTDTLALRLASQVTGQEGWIDDAAINTRVPRTRTYALRGTALWKPTDRLTVRVKAANAQEDQRGGLPIVRANCPPPAAFGPAAGFCAAVIGAGAAPYSAYFDRNTSSGQRTSLHTESYNGTVSYDAGRFTITSVTGYNLYHYGLNDDLDASPLNLITLQNPERYRQFSQELRVASDGNGTIQYLAGGYYQHGRLTPDQVFTYGFLTPTISGIPPFRPLVPYLPLAVENTFTERGDLYSAFGSLTVKPISKVEITGALRWSDVHKDFDRSITVGQGNFLYQPVLPFPAAVAPLGAAFASTAGLAVPGTASLSRTDRHLSRSASIQYEPAGAVMLYARYDNGFKAGGFNGIDQTSTAALLPFAPEEVNAYEVGARTRFLGNRAALNVALFRSRYTNLQLSGVTPTATGAFVNRVQNAGGAISQGVEVDASLRVTPALRYKF